MRAKERCNCTADGTKRETGNYGRAQETIMSRDEATGWMDGEKRNKKKTVSACRRR